MTSEPCTLLWLDLETTGLDLRNDHPLEAAIFVTNPDGTNPRDYMQWCITPNDLNWEICMIPFVREMHTTNGLLNDISENSVMEQMFYEQLLLYIRAQIMDHRMVGNKLTVAGSGVGPFDLPFIKERCPTLDQYLNYFVMDVEVIGRFYKQCLKIDFPDRPKVGHRAADDIQDHYQEFLQYKAVFNGN